MIYGRSKLTTKISYKIDGHMSKMKNRFGYKDLEDKVEEH
jgi:hypothetical protein